MHRGDVLLLWKLLVRFCGLLRNFSELIALLLQTWHELARPQVHGYDMQTICALSRYRFASGAEEKIVRTFQAPANFVQNFRRICNVNEEDVEGDVVIRCKRINGKTIKSQYFNLNRLFLSLAKRSIGTIVGSFKQSCLR